MKTIKESKEVLELAASLVNAVKSAKADGVLNAVDIQYLVSPLMKLIPAFEGVGEIPGEWSDLTDQEIQEIVAYAKVVKDDPEFLKLVYHVIGLIASVTSLINKKTDTIHVP